MDINIDHLRGTLTENIKSGINTDVAEIVDPNSKRKIKLHLESRVFKNRKLQTLVGTSFDEAGAVINIDFLGNYKPKEVIILDMLPGATIPYTFDGLFELINY